MLCDSVEQLIIRAMARALRFILEDRDPSRLVTGYVPTTSARRMSLEVTRVDPIVKLLDTTQPIENPATGERFEIRDHSPEALTFDYYLAPGGFAVGRIEHAHPRQQESFEIQSGELTVSIGGDEWVATPRTKFTIPARTPHTVWNDGQEETHAIVEIRPALAIRTFFETMSGLSRAGETNRWGLPGPLQLAVIANEFREELYFPALPVTVQRAMAAALAPVGRSLGYRARYPGYSDASG